ncbi:glucosamine inositolphosphorylceramide transferase family protein [Halobacillus andaensis]|nr:hypothetical protein [Halobacillus andaensis]MBP2005811.1 hypothetical protein [Halobacillus andaensis]
MFDQHSIDKWQHKILKHVLSLKDVQLELIICRCRSPHCPIQREVSKIINLWNPSPMTIMKEEIADIKNFSLDFILYAGGQKNVEDDMKDIAKYGIWTFKHQLEKKPFGIEFSYEKKQTKVEFIKLERNQSYRVLKNGVYPTMLHSYANHLEFITEEVAEWPSQVCRDILNHRAHYFDKNEKTIYMEKPRIGVIPTLQIYKSVAKNRVGKWFNMLFRYEYWNVGVIESPIHMLLNNKQPKIQWLIPKKDVYYADPFGYEDGNNNLKILIEEVDPRTVKGKLSEVSFRKEGGNFHSLQVEHSKFQREHHLSYPFLLHSEGKIYCIPEASEANKVTIYQLNTVTGELENPRTIIDDFPAVDSTFIHYNDTWWLFCTKASRNGAENRELHIYYSDDLLKGWKPHALNPVKIDVSSSRPAGTPFVYNKELYRPAQDCSSTYGGSVVINKITSLTQYSFKEESCTHIFPQKDSLYPDGFHTVSSMNGELMMVDGKRISYHVSHLFKKFYKVRMIWANSKKLKLGFLQKKL